MDLYQIMDELSVPSDEGLRAAIADSWFGGDLDEMYSHVEACLEEF